MKLAAINELKQELSQLPAKKVIELCIRLARFKKENKELLNYLLFEADNTEGYIESIKLEMDESFAELPRGNWYLSKKGLRKILRLISKYSKHIGSKEAELEMLIHFCVKLKASGINYRSYKALSSLYDQQLKKLNNLVEQVHEDLKFDYKKQIETLSEEDNNNNIVKKLLRPFKH